MSIEVRHLSFSYGSRQVLRDVSFSVGKGRLLSVLGPNGVGKSTLFRCILGLLHGFQGEITVEDPDGVLKLGMDADADILTAQAEGAVAVPVEAVKTDKDGDYVYTVAPSANAEEAQAGIW